MTCFVSSPAWLASKRFFQLLSRHVLFLFLVNSIAANAQDLAGLEQGIKPYGSYHGGDIDSVSMVNGSLTLNIPLISYPQRGGKLHMGFVLVYANAILQPFASCNPVTHVCSTSGYQVNHRLQAPDQTAISIVPDFLPSYVDGINTPSVMTSFDGAVHEMGEVGTSGSNFISVDATGNWFTQQGSNLNLGTLIDREGNRYNNSTGTLEDTNGNLITQNSNSQEVTGWNDTIGRVIPAPWNTTSTSNLTGCTGSQPTTGAGLWTPPGPNGGTSQFKFCYASFSISFTAPDCIDDPAHSNCQGTSGSATYLQNLVLPNGTAWTFEYDVFGELSSVTLPTGGTISYSWTYTSGVCVGTEYMQNGVNTWLYPYGRGVTSRTVNANDGTGPHVWNYSIPTTINNGSSSPVQSIVTDPLLNDTVHWQTPLGGSCSRYESELDQYSGSHTSGTLLRKVATTYNYTYGGNGFAYGSVAINAVPSTITTTEYPGGQASEVTKTYDSGVAVSGGYNAIYGDVLTKSNYDYTTGTPPGNLLRTTVNTYMALSGPNSSSYLANNLLDLPYTIQVKNGAGAQIGYTTFGYDESGLQASNVTEQKTTGESYPGNQTSVHRWLNGSTVSQTPCNVSVSNGNLISSTAYYDTGEVQTSTDPCNYQTGYSYSSTYQGAYLTTATNPLGQATNYGYDFNTGLMTSIQDANLQTTSKGYDIMSRLTLVSYPDTGSTSFCYTDTGGTCTQSGPPYAVVATKAITSSPALNEVWTDVFDGLGRISQTQLNSDPSGTTYTLTTYDALGRKSQVYNPTRCSPISTNCGETTWGYTTTNYDALSRVTSVTEQDGSAVSTNYAAFPCKTVTDEAGKSRKSCIDGLGRLTGAWEDPAGLNYETDYQYNALSNLIKVTQNGSTGGTARTRTFQYDSLSHLTSATNPESGIITYGYDADGNLVTKAAPSPNQPSTGTKTVTTTYTYDALNRITGKSYQDNYAANPATPSVSYGYDGANLSNCPTPIGFQGGSGTNSIGRRTAMCFAAGSKSWTYDPMGRVHSENDRFIWLVPPYSADVFTLNGVPTLSENTSYSYYLNGDLFDTYYPGPKGPPDYEFTTTENAAGQVATAGDIYYNVLTSATYTPGGQLATALVGPSGGYNGNKISNTYNNRLQPMLVSASTYSGTPILNLTYDFNLGNGTSGTDNGNVIQIANGKDSNRTQNFIYDPLNRIWQAYSNGPNWGETYSPNTYAAGTVFSAANAGIDAWGNLTNRSGVTSKTDYEPLSCSANAKNQLNTCYSIDAAGNVIQNGTTTYTYDAENRLIATGGLSYVYDGDGQRVEKCTEGATAGTCASNATGKFYWLHAGGGTLAESDLGGNWTAVYGLIRGQNFSRVDLPANVVHYYFRDHLGSTSIVTDPLGNIQNESDYYPYGGEMVITAGDSNRYKFTGKERDTESGLDNFGARYNASTMGRFMTPDPLLNSGRPSSPQTWNRYSYALNNPLKIKDPTGLYNVNCGDDKSCQKSAERLKKGLEKLQNKVDKMKDSDQKTRLEHALGAMGTQNDGNNVNVSFGAIAGTAAATTDAHFDSATNSYSSFDVKFDMSKTGNSDANGMAINGAHEGAHVGDYQDPLGRSQNPATAMDGFQYEFRGYQTSAWAAQALGVSPLSFGGNVIWNSSWAAADRQTLMGRGITGIVTGAPYNQPENPIHDPWPDRFPEPNPGPF